MLSSVKDKLYDFIVVLIVLIIVLFISVISNNITESKIKVLKQEKYNIYSKNLHDEIKLLIKNKKELTFIVALSLSKNNNIIEALKTNNIQLLRLKEFSKTLKENTKLKNAWFQIIDNKGTTFYRSWTKKRGDAIIKARLDIASMIEKPRTMCTISTGKFDMTFKSMVPIYDDKKFIGIFEIITHFTSVSKQLEQEETDSIILVDKKYKKQLTKPLSKTFIDDYYVANGNAKSEFLTYIKDNKVENYIHSTKKYMVDEKENKFIVMYNILDINNNPMATIVAFKDLDLLNMDDIGYIRTNMLFYVILFILLITLIGYYFIVNKHSKELDSKVKKRTKELNKEKKYIQTILDTNPSIIVVTKDSQIRTANKRFLEFFEYKTVEDFKKDYTCICDFFVTLDDIEFPEDKMINGQLWSTYLAVEFDTEHLVTLEFKNEEYYFTVNGSYLKNNGEILLTFQNISDLKTKDKLLFEQSKMASMGEMIGNIAHQWRQPLSVISTGATGMKLQKEFDNLTDEYFNETCDVIDSNAQYLSKTIDDFRDFIKGSRKKEKFIFNKLIGKLIHLVKPSLRSHHIQLILNLEENIEINGCSNELMQCLMNVYSNSKDALKQVDQNDRFMFIDAKIEKDHLNIDIKDTGDGIPEELLTKIFDPYFTTKHSSMGTGLGLHMTYNLIVDGMNGSIDVSNNKFEYNGKTYKGALFNIKLPLE